MSGQMRKYSKEFIDTRKAVTKDHNQAANNAKGFAAAFKLPLSTASYQAMLKAVNKMIEPNSAVMQSEADAFMGADAANEIRRWWEATKTGLEALPSGGKGQGATEADKNELGRLYNALVGKLKVGKAAIEAGSGNYFTNIKNQLQAEYGDSLSPQEFEELMDKKRFKSILYGNMHLESLPGAVKIKKITKKSGGKKGGKKPSGFDNSVNFEDL